MPLPSARSNGQTEGLITKLKLVKRQIYDRGKLQLPQYRLQLMGNELPINRILLGSADCTHKGALLCGAACWRLKHSRTGLQKRSDATKRKRF